MRYRPEIDGLRALAVLPVILFHAGVAPVPGGYVGVDVFFVISGYLITALVAGDLRAGRFSLADFYERRARRILPTLFLVAAACIPFAWFWMIPSQREDFFQSLVAVNLFASNGLFWVEDGYFAHASEQKPLLHTWSLAVEEQFYLVFPLILIAAGRGRGAPWRLIAGLTLLSFVACLWAVGRDPAAAFYLTPFRAWELGVGALAACALAARPGLAHDGLAWAGLAAIGASVLLFGRGTPFPSAWALLPVLGAAAVVVFAGAGTRAARVLSWRPLAGLGLVSYSAYLWHQPVFAFARIRFGEPPAPAMWALVAAVLVLAWLSWRFVERPWRRRGGRGRGGAAPRRAGLFATASVAAGAFVALGLWGAAERGFRDEFDRWNVAAYRWDNAELQRRSWALLSDDVSVLGPPVGDPRDVEPWFSEAAATRLLVVGNSHSKDVYNAFAHHPGLPDCCEIARFGTQIAWLSEPSHAFWRSPNYRAADVVFFASHYAGADLDALPGAAARVLADGKRAVIVGNGPDFSGDLVRTLADAIALDAIRFGAARPHADIAAAVNAAYWRDLGNPRQAERRAINAALRRIVADTETIFLDRLDYLCDAGQRRCFAMAADLAKHFYDRHHTTMAGARLSGRRMAETGWLDPVLAPVPAGGPLRR